MTPDLYLHRKRAFARLAALSPRQIRRAHQSREEAIPQESPSGNSYGYILGTIATFRMGFMIFLFLLG